MAQTNGFAPGELDGPPRQWRLALRRLPVTLAVLIVAGSSAAGLAYVASGSGAKRFPATLQNDLGQTVQFGACAESDCKKGGALNPQRLAPGQEVTVALQPGSGGNPVLILDLAGKRVGCLPLTYPVAPATPPTIRLSTAVAC